MSIAIKLLSAQLSLPECNGSGGLDELDGLVVALLVHVHADDNDAQFAQLECKMSPNPTSCASDKSDLTLNTTLPPGYEEPVDATQINQERSVTGEKPMN